MQVPPGYNPARIMFLEGRAKARRPLDFASSRGTLIYLIPLVDFSSKDLPEIMERLDDIRDCYGQLGD